MRGVLDWIVVSIAVLMLLVNRWLAPADISGAAASERQAARATRSDQMAMQETNPFAYIHEDGSEVYLPMKRPAQSAARAATSSATTAVFTWSAQDVTSARDFPLRQ